MAKKIKRKKIRKQFEIIKRRGKSYQLIGYSPIKSELRKTKREGIKRGYNVFIEKSEMRAGGKDFFGKKYKAKKWHLLYGRKSG